jgi:hypothetical protein
MLLTLDCLQLLRTAPALFPYTSRLAKGLDPLMSPLNCSLPTLTMMYFIGPDSYAAGLHGSNVADMSIDAPSLVALAPVIGESPLSMDYKLVTLMSRATARRRELSQIWQTVLARKEVHDAANATQPYALVR